MFASNSNLKTAVVKAILVACGLFVAIGSFGCDTYGLGAGLGSYFDASGLIGDTLDYRHDVMDWSAQSWSDVILGNDYVSYDTWDTYDMTYPWY